MTVRPILFSAPMVRALIAGTKTQTRRILNPQPVEWQARVIDVRQPTFDDEHQQWGQWETLWDAAIIEPIRDEWRPLRVRFAVGDLLWVRENLSRGATTLAWKYAATDGLMSMDWPAYRVAQLTDWAHRQKRAAVPSIHMPRWASRLTLRVSDVRVQQLKDISEADADAECFGGDFPGKALPEFFPGDPDRWAHLTIPECYGRLWDKINGVGAWESNPWVVATIFSVIKANVDDVLRKEAA